MLQTITAPSPIEFIHNLSSPATLEVIVLVNTPWDIVLLLFGSSTFDITPNTFLSFGSSDNFTYFI